MPRNEGVGRVLESEVDLVDLSGNQRSRPLVPVAMRQVEKSIGDPRGLSVGKDILDAGGDEAARRVAGDADEELAGTEDLEALSKGLRIENE
jgi:hypothetical protein